MMSVRESQEWDLLLSRARQYSPVEAMISSPETKSEKYLPKTSHEMQDLIGTAVAIQVKSLLSWRAWLICAVIVLFSVVAVQRYQMYSGYGMPDPVSKIGLARRLTVSDTLNIKIGMTYSEVAQLLGWAGKKGDDNLQDYTVRWIGKTWDTAQAITVKFDHTTDRVIYTDNYGIGD